LSDPNREEWRLSVCALYGLQGGVLLQMPQAQIGLL
jgi:hypothetical protein